MQKRISDALPSDDLKKDFEYLMMRMMTAEEDCDVSDSKLSGVWPGWEWMKDARKAQEGLQ